MSIDVFFQPVDLRMWQERLFPYFRGERDDLEDLFQEADQFRQLKNLIDTARAAVIPYERDPSYPDWYDHVRMQWFRPFFIVENDPAVVAQLVQGYHMGGRKVALDLVRQQVRLIAPDRAARVKMPKRAARDKHLAECRRDLAELRAAFAVLRQSIDEEERARAVYDAAQLYSREIYSCTMRFNEELQPRWWIRAWFMDYLMNEFGVPDWQDLCEPVLRLFGVGLLDDVSGGAFELLTQPRDLGWSVRAEHVPLLRERIACRVSEIDVDLATDDDNQQRALLSLLEALTYAQQQGLALAERIC